MTTYERIQLYRNFNVPQDWLAIQTIDLHTGGEPLRVILDGFPPLEGEQVPAYRRLGPTRRLFPPSRELLTSRDNILFCSTLMIH